MGASRHRRFNHDGTDDIVWYNSTTGNVDIWQILNGHWSASVDVGSHPPDGHPLASAISITIGPSDIAWYNAASGRGHLEDRERALGRKHRVRAHIRSSDPKRRHDLGGNAPTTKTQTPPPYPPTHNRGYTGTVHHPIYWGPIGPVAAAPVTGTSFRRLVRASVLRLGLGRISSRTNPCSRASRTRGDLGDFGYNQMIHTDPVA